MNFFNIHQKINFLNIKANKKSITYQTVRTQTTRIRVIQTTICQKLLQYQSKWYRSRKLLREFSNLQIKIKKEFTLETITIIIPSQINDHPSLFIFVRVISMHGITRYRLTQADSGCLSALKLMV